MARLLVLAATERCNLPVEASVAPSRSVRDGHRSSGRQSSSTSNRCHTFRLPQVACRYWLVMKRAVASNTGRRPPNRGPQPSAPLHRRSRDSEPEHERRKIRTNSWALSQRLCLSVVICTSGYLISHFAVVDSATPPDEYTEIIGRESLVHSAGTVHSEL